MDEDQYRLLEIMRRMGMNEQDPDQQFQAANLMAWEDDAQRPRNFSTQKDNDESMLRSNLIRNAIYEQAQQPELNRFEKLRNVLQQRSILSSDDLNKIDTELINKRFPR